MSEKTVLLRDVPVGHVIQRPGDEYDDTRAIRLNYISEASAYVRMLRLRDGIEYAVDDQQEVTDLGPVRFGPSEADKLVADWCSGDVEKATRIFEAYRTLRRRYFELQPLFDDRYAIPPPPRMPPGEDARTEAGGRGITDGAIVHVLERKIGTVEKWDHVTYEGKRFAFVRFSSADAYIVAQADIEPVDAAEIEAVER